MRGWAVGLMLAAPPAGAWEFAAAPVCTLSHRTADVAVVITHDPRLPEPYAIALTLTAATWPAAPHFGIVFDGPGALTISTVRHMLSDDGRTLTVADRGFGNVLDGIGSNRVATAVAGPFAVPVPLDGAGPPLAAFRDCPGALTS